MGNQQPSLEQRKVQRLSLYGSRIASDWQFEVVDYRKVKDIVYAFMKVNEVIKPDSLANYCPPIIKERR